MKNIVFLGSKDIGYECLKLLIENQEKLGFHVQGVLTNNRGDKISELAKSNALAVLNSLDDYLGMDSVDLCISVQYHEILKREHLSKADLTVNLHMAPLPEYRGCNQFSFAIINGDKEFGTTIHIMDEGVDSGDILFEKRFKIPANCWVDQLYAITFTQSISLFEESLPELICNNIRPVSQESYANRKRSIHFRKDIEALKRIDLSWNSEKIEAHVRATAMPGFSPPYCLIGQEKVYFQRQNK